MGSIMKTLTQHRILRPVTSAHVGVLVVASAIAGALLHTHPASAETLSDQALAERLGALREDVAARQADRYSPELLLSLRQLSEALISADALTEAEQTIEQQIQLVKVDDGLYTEQQVPFLFQQLGILAARGNWEAVSDRVQYLTWLLDRTTIADTEQRLQMLKQTRDWIRLLLLQGPRSQEADYLMQWQALEQSAVAIGEKAELDPTQMEALIYDAAIAELYIALAIVAPGYTSQQLIQRNEGQPAYPNVRLTTSRITTVSDVEAMYGARTSTVIDRAFHNAMGRHRQLIDQLEEQYTAPLADNTTLEEHDPETAALLQLYLGDAILLRQQYEPRRGSHISPARGSSATGSAARHYQDAWELLLEAGYDAATLNEYFSCPALLPLPTFHTRLEALQPDCQRQAEGLLVLPAFVATRHGVPALPYQGTPDNPLIADPEGTSTVITFQVGLNGQADRLEFGESSPDATSSRIRGRDILQGLQFRPALKDGRPIRTANLQMQLVSVEPD